MLQCGKPFGRSDREGTLPETRGPSPNRGSPQGTEAIPDRSQFQGRPPLKSLSGHRDRDRGTQRKTPAKGLSCRPCNELVFSETVWRDACADLWSHSDLLISPCSPESSERLQKKLHGLSAAPAGIRFTHDFACRGLREVKTGPREHGPSLLASIHKKTLAGFSGSSGVSIAAAALSPTRRLRGSRAQASNWLRALFLFSLFYARNISVAPL